TENSQSGPLFFQPNRSSLRLPKRGLLVKRAYHGPANGPTQAGFNMPLPGAVARMCGSALDCGGCGRTLGFAKRTAWKSEDGMSDLVLAIDQGTTGTTVFVIDSMGRVRGRAYREIRQYYPRPGWVEHDAEEIAHSAIGLAKAALKTAHAKPSDLRGIG